MPQIVTLAEAKMHLRVTNDVEDALITRHIATAGEWIANYLNKAVPGLYDSPPTVPKSIQDAALMIVENLFENRGSLTEKDLKKNPTMDGLLSFYRVGMGI